MLRFGKKYLLTFLYFNVNNELPSGEDLKNFREDCTNPVTNKSYTQEAFGELFGIKRTSIAAYESGRVGIDRGILKQIEEHFKKIVTISNKPTKLKKEYNEAKEIGEEIRSYLSKSNTEFIELSDGKYIMNTKLVPVKAYAGYITGWGDEEYINELPVHPIIVEKPHRGEYKSFEVGGHSMDDNSAKAIQEGDIVTARRIDRSLWQSKLHLKKFSEYVIVSLKGIVIKEIIAHDIERHCITCHSLNPDKKNYADFEICMDEVIQFFNVVQVTKKRR